MWPTLIYDYFDGDVAVSSNVYSTYDFGARAEELFNQIKKPKFIMLGFNAPHVPLSAPTKLKDKAFKIR